MYRCFPLKYYEEHGGVDQYTEYINAQFIREPNYTDNWYKSIPDD